MFLLFGDAVDNSVFAGLPIELGVYFNVEVAFGLKVREQGVLSFLY